MDTSKIIYLFLMLAGGTVVLIFLLIPIFVKLSDWLAFRAAREYCRTAGLEFVEAKAWPNHYGLYFRKDGQRLYASFDFERNRTITWKKGSPLEIAENKLKT
jgi:hypothetical protein